MIRNKIWEISKWNIGIGQMHISRSSGLGREIWEDNCLPCLSSFLSVFQKDLRHPNGWKTQTKRKEIGEKVK